MSPSFTVIICHGSYHTPEPYQPFLDALQKKGIEGYCPQLPTSDLTKLNVGDISNPDFNRDSPLGGYPQPADDAEIIKSLLDQLIVEQGKNVMLYGHSSGGVVAAASAAPELQAKNREAKGLSGGIIGIFYACAIVIPVGESLHSFFQPKDGSPFVIPHFCKYYVRTPLLCKLSSIVVFLN